MYVNQLKLSALSFFFFFFFGGVGEGVPSFGVDQTRLIAQQVLFGSLLGT